MVVSSNGERSKKRVLWVENMGEDASMLTELEGKEYMKVVGAAGFLDIGHENVLDIRGKVRDES